MVKRFLDIVFLLAVVMALSVLFAVIFLPSFWDDWVMEYLGGEEKREVVKLIGLGIAGILAFWGAIAVNRRAEAQIQIAKSQLRSARAQLKVASAQFENNRLVEKGHIHERFRMAVDHLGGEKAAERIASFYEFSYLARDNDEKLRENIFDILCAHLRQTTADKEYKEEIGFIDESGFADEGDNSEVRPTEEVQSLLGVLFQSKDSLRGLIAAETKPNLRRVFLMNADFRGANLQNARLYKANLQGADLRKAKLCKANLQRVDLQDVKLQDANLREANLRDVNLQGANLDGADLQGANFRGADLWNADFREAKNLETIQLAGARIKGTKFPEGYELSRDVIIDDKEEDDPF